MEKPETPPIPEAVEAGVEAETEETREERTERRIELLAAVVMAVATILTAWSAYQSARWGGESSLHELRVIGAIVKQSKFANLAEQRRSLDVNLFGQWVSAVNADDKKLADFIFDRFPEPLETATIAWQRTDPLNNPAAPTSPFFMPEYALTESAEELRWEETATAEAAAADRAGLVSERYLLFTVIFSTTLFFAGISGKFGSFAINVAVLVIGGVVLLISTAIMISLPTTLALPFT
jgi:hypothetical protein